MDSEPPPARRPSSFPPLHSRTVRVGLFLALLGGAASLYASQAQDAGESSGSAGLAALGIGLSLSAGYVVGWLFRKVRFAALVVLAAVVLGVFALKQLGLLDDPVIEQNLREGADQALAGASRLKELATGSLPSGAAAGLGAFLGYWSNRSARDRTQVGR